MGRRPLIAFVLSLAICSLVVARKRDKDPVFAQIDPIVKSLSEISGLAELHPVEYGSISKKQLNRFLRKRIKKTLKPDEIQADELALKMFGLVPRDFDLKKSTVDLLTEQAAAFYDYDEKKLFLLQGAPLEEQTATLAHELAHALADQHFDLGRFMDESPTNDDENLAHTAVVEGQASWLMLAYDLARSGKPPLPNDQVLKSIEGSGEENDNDFPVLKASPLYIKESLLFPYTDGVRFFHAVFQRMGKSSFSAVFENPPAASSQIFHPERYFRHEKISNPELPKLNFGEEATEITEGSVGEFDHRMLLWQYVGESQAASLAPHLRGAQFRVASSGKHGLPVLEYVSQWDSFGAAAEYFQAYKRILRGKSKRCEISTDSGSALAGQTDRGFFVTHLSGDTLVSVEGLDEPVSWARLRPRWSPSPVARLHTYAKLKRGVV